MLDVFLLHGGLSCSQSFTFDLDALEEIYDAVNLEPRGQLV